MILHVTSDLQITVHGVMTLRYHSVVSMYSYFFRDIGLYAPSVFVHKPSRPTEAICFARHY